MTEPSVKGWCPGAHRPMISGDGLIVRIRPKLAQFSKNQLEEICRLSDIYGSGIVEITNRANLQLRGIDPRGHERLLDNLHQLDLLDRDLATEARRNIIITPDWVQGDLSEQITKEFYLRLSELPDLPAKFGFAVDLGRIPRLQNVSADIRIERTADGTLLVCPDGSAFGRAATTKTLVDCIIDVARWFNATGGHSAKRMRIHLTNEALPKAWDLIPRNPQNIPLHIGEISEGQIIGIPFGQCNYQDVLQLLSMSKAKTIRLTPWRSILLKDGKTIDTDRRFITCHKDPLLQINACPGQPMCQSATVETRPLARDLAGKIKGKLHISGCSKGCARSKDADITLVGENGTFNLIQDGHAGDTPQKTGLTGPLILKTLDSL
ncbi:MAG: cobalamin biosynthesis protein CobG [Marinovum sp.]|nr:cobalamin biosynthesis protein CobG [Marinovum sp.]